MPKPKTKPKKRGRPSVYTKALGDEICDRLAAGESLRSICKDTHMPDEKAVRLWALKPDHPFAVHYAAAREAGYLSMAEEMLEIADDGSNDWMTREGKDGELSWQLNGEHVQRSRLRVESRKWMLTKMLPKVFGEKVVNEMTGADGGPIKTEAVDDLESARRVAFLLGTAVTAAKQRAKAKKDEPSE